MDCWLLIVAFYTCWAGPAPAAGSAVTALPPIRIGVSHAQSGPSGPLGRQLVLGSKAYFDLVNRSGGIHGQRVELIVRDDGYKADAAVQNTFHLIHDDKVLFLSDYFGTSTITQASPLLKYYADRRIVDVAPLTGAEAQRKPPYDRFVFNIRASYTDETLVLVDYLYGMGYRKIGFLGQADSYGKDGEMGVARELATHGLKIAEPVVYRKNDSGKMREQVEILRRSGADAVIAVGVDVACAEFVREARLAGWKVPVAMVSFAGADSVLRRLGDYSRAAHRDLTGNLISSQVAPSPDQTEYALIRRYRAKGAEEDYGSISLEGWLNAVVVGEAMRRTPVGATRGEFVAAMESLGGWDPGLGLPLAFSHADHQGLRKVWLNRTEGGRWVPVEHTP